MILIEGNEYTIFLSIVSETDTSRSDQAPCEAIHRSDMNVGLEHVYKTVKIKGSHSKSSLIRFQI